MLFFPCHCSKYIFHLLKRVQKQLIVSILVTCMIFFPVSFKNIVPRVKLKASLLERVPRPFLFLLPLFDSFSFARFFSRISLFGGYTCISCCADYVAAANSCSIFHIPSLLFGVHKLWKYKQKYFFTVNTRINLFLSLIHISEPTRPY